MLPAQQILPLILSLSKDGWFDKLTMSGDRPAVSDFSSPAHPEPVEGWMNGWFDKLTMSGYTLLTGSYTG